MELLLHYCWKHKMWPIEGLQTTDGQEVEVIDPGLHNRNSGPDFFNAKVKIGGTLWVGNVEIHDKASDWYVHGHQTDANYNNVVLHVVGQADRSVQTESGQFVPQMQLKVPQTVYDNYAELLKTDAYPPCYRIIPDLTALTIHAWMAALQTERLEQKTIAIEQRAQQAGGSARHIPLQAVAKHRDNLFQIEAIFMGQAGLLDIQAVPERYQQEALNEGYFAKLRNEYLYLAHKFSLKPMDFHRWRFLRLRPQNFPHIRISQLAMLYYERRTSLSALVDSEDVVTISQMLHTQVTPYWETHYTFGSESVANAKHLSPFSINLLLINTCVPMLFAYGRHIMKEALCDRAFDILEKLKAENNHIIRMWQACGLQVKSAGDSQALIQLKKEYCDKKDCLRCRIGYEYLKRKK